MTAIQTPASANILINLSSVKFLLIGKASVKVINSGDIAVSARTVDKLMITSDDPTAALMNQAFLDTTVQLWDQNVVNGEYVIAYELDPGLHDKLKAMLPEVCKL